MKNLRFVFLILSFFTVESLASDCVILLHGLARSESSMSTMAKTLEASGYHVVNVGYPSRKKNIALLSKEVVPNALAACPKNADVNFVTHSMGGIIVRQYLSENNIPNLKHVVMLGPPNQGSEVVDKFKNIPGFKLLNGPSGLQLGTGEFSVPNVLGPATFSLGIIAGTRSINLFLSSMLPNPDDGKVSVERTKLEGMSDHISMPVTHPFMMKNKKVIAQVQHFLTFGEFSRKKCFW